MEPQRRGLCPLTPEIYRIRLMNGGKGKNRTISPSPERRSGRFSELPYPPFRHIKVTMIVWLRKEDISKLL